MASKTVNELDSASLPIQTTDKILVSRDGINVNKATVADLPLQPTLVSGTNIKTINGTPVLGSGDITVATTGSTIGRALTASINTLVSDNLTMMRNETATNITVTIDPNTTSGGAAVMQISTGIITLVAGSGVTLRGANLQTFAPNDIIYWEPTGVAANDYIVKLA